MIRFVFSCLLARHLHFLFCFFNVDKPLRKKVWLGNPLGLRLWLNIYPSWFWSPFFITQLEICHLWPASSLLQRKNILGFGLFKLSGSFVSLLSVLVTSITHFSWAVYSCLDAWFWLMLLFISPSSVLFWTVGIIQQLRAVSSFLLLSQSFSTSLCHTFWIWVLIFCFVCGVFCLVFKHGLPEVAFLFCCFLLFL